MGLTRVKFEKFGRSENSSSSSIRTQKIVKKLRFTPPCWLWSHMESKAISVWLHPFISEPWNPSYSRTQCHFLYPRGACAFILIKYRQWCRLPKKHDNWRPLNMAGRNLFFLIFRGIASDRQLFLLYFSCRFVLLNRKKMWFWRQNTFHVRKFNTAAKEPPEWEKSLHTDQTVLTVSDILHRATHGFADKTIRCYELRALCPVKYSQNNAFLSERIWWIWTRDPRLSAG